MHQEIGNPNSLPPLNGYGRDVALARADDLDLLAVQHIKALREFSTKHIHAVDVGPGLGGQMIRMAKAGASKVTGIDVVDHRRGSGVVIPADVTAKLNFIHRSITTLPDIDLADVIVCQRMIHYLPFSIAEPVLKYLWRKIIPGGKLYISATGLETEIGKGYPAADKKIQERFTCVAPDAARAYAITRSVCLYTLNELKFLVTNAGWHVLDAYTSEFGNHKVIAERVRYA